MEQDSDYNINDAINGGFEEVREPMELALPLNCRVKSYRDDAGKSVGTIADPTKMDYPSLQTVTKNMTSKGTIRIRLGIIECNLGVRQSTFHS